MAGADAGVADKWGVTCLMWACGFSGDEELIAMLVGPTAASGMMGAAFPKLPHYLNWTDLADPGPKTAVMFAWNRWIASPQVGCSAEQGFSSRSVLASLLAAQGLPLHAAVMLSSPPSRFSNLTSDGDVTKLEEALLHNGGAASAGERDDFGRTALALACFLGHKTAAERLAASEAALGALEAKDSEGLTAMEYARSSFSRAVGDSLAARLYEAHGLPLHAAVALGDAAQVQTLLQTAVPGAAAAQEPCGGSTALAMACKLGCAAAAEALVSATAAAGAVDAADSEGMTAMMHVSMKGDAFRGVMGLLLQAGARSDLVDARHCRNRSHFHTRSPEQTLVFWGCLHQHNVPSHTCV